MTKHIAIKQHPTLPILCNGDTGEVLIPASGKNKEHWTKGCPSNKGYLRVCFQGKMYYVHRLIAETFLEHVAGKDEVDHINRVVTDNRKLNLRFCDRHENLMNRRLKFGIHSDDPNYSNIQMKAYRQSKYDAGYKNARMPDGSRKWVKEDSLSLAA